MILATRFTFSAERSWKKKHAFSLKKGLKTESTTKLSNCSIQWTKTLSQNNLKHVAFFFRFFKG